MKKRLDQLLVQRQPQWTRTQAQKLIEEGCVDVFEQSWKTVTKPGAKYLETDLTADKLRVRSSEELTYVSRGALKLKKAFEEFSLNPKGALCLDVGLSTGGFTDYLLKNGALRVLGVDVGTDQLHPSLKLNAQLVYQDKVNAKNGLPEDLLNQFFEDGEPRLFDFIVVDVSFISLEKVLPLLFKYLKMGGFLVTLVKPQFELTRSDLNKKGVVKSPEKATQVQEKILGFLMGNKLQIVGSCPSPIEGENGNQEFLIVSSINQSSSFSKSV